MDSKKKYAVIKRNLDHRFVAIGVGQGDAFFMEKGDRSFLVDGGRSVSSFPQQFMKATGRNHVNVLTCTHNDSDHGNGILGFLKTGLVADEVWLPASWMDRLEDILLYPLDFLEELIKDIGELQKNRVSDLSELGDQYAVKTTDKKDSRFVEVVPQEVYHALEQVSDMKWFLGRFLTYGLLPMNNIFVEAVSGAALIEEIVLAAYHSGSLIKWFDFVGDKNQTYASGGIDGFLLPVNAIEVVQIRRPKRGALEYIALTRANKQSLVFMSPNTEDIPGVLFTADSDLRFYQQINWHNHMIITTPHHGSEANRYAYERFRREAGGTIDVSWVRSDGKFMNRPGKPFLAINDRKFCTLCRNSSFPKQDVRLALVNHSWRPLHTRKCVCQ